MVQHALKKPENCKLNQIKKLKKTFEFLIELYYPRKKFI